MKQIIISPDIYMFETCEEFWKEIQLNENDLILTNKWIYQPLFGKFETPARVVYQEQYGEGEPTDLMVESIQADMGKFSPERIIAIGGGTIIDIAKVLVLENNGSVDELYDKMPDLRKRAKLIVIPTTCGTGSEVTNLSILNRTRLHTKMGLYSAAMYADDAILIPETLKQLPLSAFATSSIDALVHAVESTLSPHATAYTKLFSYKAIEMQLEAYLRIVKAGNTAESRAKESKQFLLASNYAGISFGTAGCATIHAMAYPLGGMCHVPHGESNYALFTEVLKEYIKIKNDGEIKELLSFMANIMRCDSDEVLTEIDEMLGKILPKKRLHEYGMKQEDIKAYTDCVLNTQQRLLAHSFVSLNYDEIYQIYTRLY